MLYNRCQWILFLRQTVERKSLKSSQKNPLIFNLLKKKKKTTTKQILYEDSVILLNLNTQSLSEAHHLPAEWDP